MISPLIASGDTAEVNKLFSFVIPGYLLVVVTKHDMNLVEALKGCGNEWTIAIQENESNSRETLLPPKKGVGLIELALEYPLSKGLFVLLTELNKPTGQGLISQTDDCHRAPMAEPYRSLKLVKITKGCKVELWDGNVRRSQLGEIWDDIANAVR
ncbi:hypothetical protein CEP51_015990 [Fusarium floridanum]|uniref:Uncharacterized protein n=1 Tax=Fusarium floridanum TaxID=1325733 RepID=A0A428NZ04_9HYPO|nr:hypothetical protein CEP51_015990 [Fusarium floridanum]